MWIKRAEQTLAENPDDSGSRSTLKTVRARHIIETQNWTLQELTDELSNDELLALGLSAVNLGKPELAQQVAARLQTRSEADPDDRPLKVSYLEVAAMAKFLSSHDQAAGADTLQQQGMAMLREALEVTEQGRLPNGAANPLKPVHELTGEAMLFAGQAEEAAGLFEQSLLRMPNRPLSLLGAARAYKQAGNGAAAGEKYEALLAIWSDDSNGAVQEARTFLGY